METQNLKGVVGFSIYKGGNWFFRLLAKAIQFFTQHSKWSHTFACFITDLDLGSYVIEAEELGVTIDSFGKYQTTDYNFELWLPLAPEEDIIKGLQKVKELNGKSYGYFQLLGFILVWLVKKIFRKKVNNPIKGGIICSELVLIYLQTVGIDKDKFSELDKNTTSPEDLYEIIDKSENFKKVTLTPQVEEKEDAPSSSS